MSQWDEAIVTAALKVGTLKGVGEPRLGKVPYRFCLFHAASSMSAEVCRYMLAEKGIPYMSNTLVFETTDNYQPAYVMLRNLSGMAQWGLVGEHEWTGSSGTGSSGFDPLVVPTLVDMDKKRVLANTKLIVEYLEAEVAEPILVPEALKEEINRHATIVDETPHPALLYSGLVDQSKEGPLWLKVVFAQGMPNVQKASISSWLAKPEVRDSEVLRPLYEAKFKKLSNVMSKLELAELENTRAATIATTKRILATFEEDLKRSGGPFVCGAAFTVADVWWGISLIRMKLLGLGHWFPPAVNEYAERMFARPEFAKANYLWPGYWKSAALLPYYRREGLIPFAKARLELVAVNTATRGLAKGCVQDPPISISLALLGGVAVASSLRLRRSLL